MKIYLQDLIKNKKMYPTWSTNSEYLIKSEKIDNQNIRIYYNINKGAVHKRIERIFPIMVEADSKFILAMGLIKGEGSNSLGKSNYRRFTFTNSNPNLINFVLNELEDKDLLKKEEIIDKSIHLMHYTKKERTIIQYWANKLGIHKSKFKCFAHEKKTSDYGVCHVYISDVLLRRVLDLIIQNIMVR